jgi:hypothetical protein
MAQNLTNQDWRSLAVQASTEMDSAKLTRIVAELCSSLDERQKTLQRQEDNQDSLIQAEHNPKSDACAN